MADKELKQIIQQLHATKPATLAQAPQLLSRAKLALLHLDALLPTETSSADHLALARETLELGAFLSIRLRDTDAFTRYFQQLQPFYALPAAKSSSAKRAQHSNESKVTGLYLLLLLSVGDYAGFHTLLEGLESSEEGKEAVEKDEFVRYPVRLEQALMEGSYDKVWSEMKSERVPSEEFAIFSEVSCVLLFLPKDKPGNMTRSPPNSGEKYILIKYDRSSSTRSAPKSPRAPSAPTLPSPSPTPRTSSSSTPKAPWCSSRSRAAGWPRTAASTFPSKRPRRKRRKRMS